MRGAAKKAAINALYILISAGLVVGAWAIAAAAIGEPLVLPGIGETLDALWALVRGGMFWRGLGGTLLRSLIGFGVSLALFFALFFAGSCSDGVRRVIEPVISAMRTLPTMAVALLLAVWASGYASPVILGAVVIMPQMYSAARARNATVPVELVEEARLNGAGRARVFSSVYLPHAAAGFAESFSSALSFNIKVVIAAEILVQTRDSIGMLMKLSQINFETSALIAMTAAAVIVSVAAEYALRGALSLALRRFAD